MNGGYASYATGSLASLHALSSRPVRRLVQSLGLIPLFAQRRQSCSHWFSNSGSFLPSFAAPFSRLQPTVATSCLVEYANIQLAEGMERSEGKSWCFAPAIPSVCTLARTEHISQPNQREADTKWHEIVSDVPWETSFLSFFSPVVVSSTLKQQLQG